MSFTAGRSAKSLSAILLAAAATVLFLSSTAFGAALGRRTLTRGMSGQDVRVLQDFLTRAGFRTPIGGDFGPITLRNVKAFQKRYKLGVDGVVGSAFVKKIRAIADSSKTNRTTRAAAGSGRHLGDRVLRKGMRGQDVRVLQDYLNRAGFSTSIDGQFGPTTLRLVKRFQTTQELTANGVVEAKTVEALRRIGDADSAGGANFDVSTVAAPVGRAKLLANGLAVPPSDAPQAVKDVIEAGNEIASKPYVYGGGHGKWIDRGYDCSGSVSYALHGGGLLDSSMPSGGFMRWEQSGKGKWITTYAHGSHMYMVGAGLRFDTSGADPSRWQTEMRSSAGFTVRHPAGY